MWYFLSGHMSFFHVPLRSRSRFCCQTRSQIRSQTLTRSRTPTLYQTWPRSQIWSRSSLPVIFATRFYVSVISTRVATRFWNVWCPYPLPEYLPYGTQYLDVFAIVSLFFGVFEIGSYPQNNAPRLVVNNNPETDRAKSIYASHYDTWKFFNDFSCCTNYAV